MSIWDRLTKSSEERQGIKARLQKARDKRLTGMAGTDVGKAIRSSSKSLKIRTEMDASIAMCLFKLFL